ncbi:ATP-dependent RNA helicase vasa isoform X7 [Bactrocera neohumeralis]|uniref:ATP-dependent RNA helicase vasa isoform X7 n=1 Tax=Bactrocera neohumeralis TaxID=98809 RepID=UPI002166961E|nr:ATP-dependent RNA helicase vasa isoform X7 [Bactrocera neohumeralis]
MRRYREIRSLKNDIRQKSNQVLNSFTDNSQKMSDWGDEQDDGRGFGNGCSQYKENGDDEYVDNGGTDYTELQNTDGGNKGFGSRRGRGGGRGRGGRDDRNGCSYGGGRRNFEDNEENENGNRVGGGFRGGRGGRGFGGRGGRGRNGFGGDRNGFNGDRDYNDTGFNNNKGENEGEQKQREFYIPPEPTDNEDEIFNSGISSGINFSKYDNIPVRVSGENAPPPLLTFENAGLRDIIMNNVRKSGYTIPTPIQKTAIPVVMDGRDLMACAQTGSGKTAAFLLPIINGILGESCDLSIGKPQAVIVSPTRELAIQIFSEARKFALGSYLKISIVYGGTSSKYQGENIAKGCHILICTPGRLLDFVEKGFITFEETRYVVLDEADRMMDMGFKDNVNTLMNHPTMRPMDERQNLMFSATFPEEIQRLAGAYLSNYIFITIGVVGGACSDVTQEIFEVKKFQKRSKLMELLSESSDGTIVFVETKRGADFLASLLSETEFPTTSIHGDRLQRQREMALADFKSGKMKVLIATSVAARGLDIKNVKHVINYDLPNSVDEYVHRIGRTGRVGNNGRATSFFDPDQDTAIASDLVKILEGASQEVPQFLRSCSGGGGGGFSNTQSKFGGRDVRKNVQQSDDNFITSAGPGPLEEEENWD